MAVSGCSCQRTERVGTHLSRVILLANKSWEIIFGGVHLEELLVAWRSDTFILRAKEEVSGTSLVKHLVHTVARFGNRH
jgi:hypothetical protein